jgi:hypothetical protein
VTAAQGVYRVDPLLGGTVVWRTFFRTFFTLMD